MQHLEVKPYINENQLQKKVSELGAELTKKFKDKKIVAICVLKGSFIFYSDLIRQIDSDITCEFLGVSSYQGLSSSGEVKVTLDLTQPIEGKHVILVEDIVDTGTTLEYLLEMLALRKPKTLRVAAILDKPSRRKHNVPVEYIGFSVPDEFLVGYGLDYAQDYRTLRDVCVLTQ